MPKRRLSVADSDGLGRATTRSLTSFNRSKKEENISQSVFQEATNVYSDIAVGDTATAIFGNVDKSTHYHMRDSRAGQHDACSQLIGSLSFDGMWQRHENIVAAYPGTCEWILAEQNEPSGDQAPCPKSSRSDGKHAFSQWLESDEAFFWICGTAGSGKSTLVNFVAAHECDVKKRLRRWAGSETVVFASFFFWRHGQFLQKSINGMIRTLLVQILRQAPSIVEDLFDEIPSLRRPDLSTSHAQCDTPWPSNHLNRLLHRAVRACRGKLCFFIDALDEFHGYDGQDHITPYEAALQENTGGLLDVIRSLRNMPEVKNCVASRPGNVFELAFDDTIRMDLEELNAADISLYVHGKLGQVMPVSTSKPFSKTLMQKSQGIFLWTKLAVDCLLNGFANGDEYEVMLSRLDELPPGLDGMYRHMLQNMDHRYADDAMLLFSLVRYLDDQYEGNDSIFFAYLVFLCRDSVRSSRNRDKERLEVRNHTEATMSKILLSRCCGLLKIREIDWSPNYRPNICPYARYRPPPDVPNLMNLSIVYVHRTAKEFLHANSINLGLRCLQEKSDVSSLSAFIQLAVVESTMHLLQSIVCPEAAGLPDWHILRSTNSYNKRFAGGLYLGFYTFIIRVLVQWKQSSMISASTCYLDQIGKFNRLFDSSTNLECSFVTNTLQGFSSSRGALPLSHIAYCGIQGLAEYALSRLCQSPQYRAYELAYLLTFSLCWLRHDHEAVDGLDIWIARLETELWDCDPNGRHIHEAWMICLSRYPANDSSEIDRRILSEAYSRAKLPLSTRIRCWTTDLSHLSSCSSHWEVSASPAALLHSPEEPYMHHWPLAVSIVRCNLTKIGLNFSVPKEQSDFILEDCFLTTPPYMNWSTAQQRRRLRCVLVYNLVKLSGLLSDQFSWEDFVERVKMRHNGLRDSPHHYIFASAPCRAKSYDKDTCPTVYPCLRKVCTTWLRGITKEGDILRDDWFDVLLEKYGYAEKRRLEEQESQRPTSIGSETG